MEFNKFIKELDLNNIEYTFKQRDLISYSRDLYPKTQLGMLHGEHPEQLPTAVVFPKSEKEIISTIKAAYKNNIGIIPYGAGSGVAGATIPVNGEVIIDVKRLDKIIKVDKTNNTLTVEPGILGERLERELNFQGFTLGHFPSSIYCSSPGGWVAARSAGQQSTFYGKIEDIILGFRGILPDGTVVDSGINYGGAFQPNFNEIFTGSEGTMIIFTKLYFRIFPQGEVQKFMGFRFGSVEKGLNTIREIIQSGIFPTAARLYDELDTIIVGSGDEDTTAAKENMIKEQFSKFEKRYPSFIKKSERFFLQHGNWLAKIIDKIPGETLMVLMFEGNKEIVDAEILAAKEICLKNNGKDMGEEPGKSWYKSRYHVSYKQSGVYSLGGFVDTMEVATTWDKLPELYRGMRKAFGKNTIVMAHFSHAYLEGANIYFTFSNYRKTREEADKHYEKIWNDALKKCSELGGTITHHHGVGLLKADAMRTEWGNGMDFMQQIKDALDEKNLMNKGKIGLL